MRDFISIAKPTVGEEEIEAVGEVLRSGMLTQGEKVKNFEEEFSEYLGVEHSIAVSNGTVALDLALKGLGLEPEGISASGWVADLQRVKSELSAIRNAVK